MYLQIFPEDFVLEILCGAYRCPQAPDHGQRQLGVHPLVLDFDCVIRDDSAAAGQELVTCRPSILTPVC